VAVIKNSDKSFLHRLFDPIRMNGKWWQVDFYLFFCPLKNKNNKKSSTIQNKHTQKCKTNNEFITAFFLFRMKILILK